MAVVSIMQEILFGDSELIYVVGDRADRIFSVISGFVILRRPNPGGASREQLIGPGAVFGAAEVLAGTVRAATARAHGEAVVVAHLPESVVNTMIDRPEAADAMVAALLTTITRAPNTQKEELATIGTASVTLIALEQLVVDQMGEAPLTIDRFPFFIGRKSLNKDADIDGPIDGPTALILKDRRPFRLSRRHFSIDRENSRFVVCDHRSFHGTIVNGTPLSASGSGLKVPLDPGKNEIIAGDAVSPFRFICIVPSLPGASSTLDRSRFAPTSLGRNDFT